MNTFKKTGGFTLVELIIVIAILAILSSVAVAGYSSYIKSANNSAVESFLNEIETHVILANAEAGSVGQIIVVEESGKLAVYVEKAQPGFAQNFPSNINGVYKNTPAAAEYTDGKTYMKFTVDVPSAWANSDYSAGATLAAGAVKWTKGGTAPTANAT